MMDYRSSPWPTSTDYTIAIQDVDSAFSHPELAEAVLSTDTFGLPLSASGQNAIAYQLSNSEGTVAVRCFLREPLEGSTRYESLASHLCHSPCPVLAPAHWLKEGIQVGEAWWPIVVMPWIEGRPLNLVVEDVAEDPEALLCLATNWREAVLELQAAGIAHGDLQHGNVLVTDDLEITFIDLDGIWVPTIGTGPPNEIGHPNYQHPNRGPSHWGPNVDTYSALLIELSLRAVAADPSLFHDLAGGENLVFTNLDLKSAGKTQVWQRLDTSTDPAVRALGATLLTWCDHQDPPELPFHEVTSCTPTRPLATTQAKTNIETADGENWWETSTDTNNEVKPPASTVLPSDDGLDRNEAPSPTLSSPGPADLSQTDGRRSRRSVRSLLGANAAVSGLVGGALAGLLGSLIQGALYPSLEGGRGVPIAFVSAIVVLLGGALTAWQTFVRGATAAAIGRFCLGAAVGAAAALASMLVADLVVTAMVDFPDDTNATTAIALSWAIVAATVGMAIGLLTGWRAGLGGFLGGALGGMMGGFLFGSFAGEFENGTLIINGSDPGTLLTAVYVSAVVGFSVGFSFRVVRRGSLTIIEGRSKGIETLIGKQEATIGSGSANTLVLAGDDAIESRHAVIDLRSEEPRISAHGHVVVDGEAVDGSAALRNGAVLAIGGSFIRFNVRD